MRCVERGDERFFFAGACSSCYAAVCVATARHWSAHCDSSALFPHCVSLRFVYAVYIFIASSLLLHLIFSSRSTFENQEINKMSATSNNIERSSSSEEENRANADAFEDEDIVTEKNSSDVSLDEPSTGHSSSDDKTVILDDDEATCDYDVESEKCASPVRSRFVASNNTKSLLFDKSRKGIRGQLYDVFIDMTRNHQLSLSRDAKAKITSMEETIGAKMTSMEETIGTINAKLTSIESKLEEQNSNSMKILAMLEQIARDRIVIRGNDAKQTEDDKQDAIVANNINNNLNSQSPKRDAKQIAFNIPHDYNSKPNPLKRKLVFDDTAACNGEVSKCDSAVNKTYHTCRTCKQQYGGSAEDHYNAMHSSLPIKQCGVCNILFRASNLEHYIQVHKSKSNDLFSDTKALIAKFKGDPKELGSALSFFPDNAELGDSINKCSTELVKFYLKLNAVEQASFNGLHGSRKKWIFQSHHSKLL